MRQEMQKELRQQKLWKLLEPRKMRRQKDLWQEMR
jgi:hypothetical protein